jgi:hypothetical protein
MRPRVSILLEETFAMSDFQSPPDYGMPGLAASAADAKPKMTPIQRMIAVFFSPGEVFADIKRKPDFLIPIIVMIAAAISFSLFFNWRTNIDQRELARRAIEKTLEKDGKRLRDLPEAQREAMERSIEFSATLQKFSPILAAVLSPALIGLLAVLYYVGCLLIRGQANFVEVFSVTTYASFATDVTRFALTALIVGVRPPDIDRILQSGGSFTMSNPAALMSESSPAWMLALARNFDFFSFWFIGLIAIGLAAVCYKRRAAQTAVIPFALWAIVTVGGVAFALIF